jgi:hypothetical protein
LLLTVTVGHRSKHASLLKAVFRCDFWRNVALRLSENVPGQMRRQLLHGAEMPECTGTLMFNGQL